MSDSPTDRLARVVELCERAVSGPWETTVNGDYVRQRDGVLIANVSPLHGDRCATSQAIAAAVNFIRDDAPALLAEVERLKALVPKPPTLEEFHVVGNRVEARFAADFAQDMAASFLQMCEEHGASNYLELQMQAGDGQRLTVTVQKVNGETPGQQKAAAIARAEAAEKVAREAEQDAARYRLLRSVTPYRFKKLQDACIADTGDTLYLLGDKLDAAIDAAILAHHGAGTGEGNES